MRIIIKLILYICLSLAILNPETAFAQNDTRESSAAEPTAVQIQEPVDWEHTSRLYRGWGWGLFGTGLLLTTVGIVVFFRPSHNDDSSDVVTMKSMGDHIAGITLTTVGGAALFTGIGLLIADAVKFNPYRRGEVAGGFQWQPELFVTPQMSGIGIRGRF